MKDENEEIIKVTFSTLFTLLKSCGGLHVIIMLNLAMVF